MKSYCSYLLIIFILYSSCIRNILKKNGILNEKVKYQKLEIPSKEVYFIGVTHLGKKEFYDDLKTTVDSFKKEGYFLFTEGVKNKSETHLPMTFEDTIHLKKVRKIIGFSLENYTQNKILENVNKKYNLISQGSTYYSDLDSSNFKNIDITNKNLVDFYEKERGEIKLDNCDSITSLIQPYNCSKLRKGERTFFKEDIILKKRNENIIKELLNTKKTKVLIIYGKAHYDGIVNLLKTKS